MMGIAGGGVPPTSRRPSFRAIPVDPPTFVEKTATPERNDSSLAVEEDRRMRRRGSQL